MHFFTESINYYNFKRVSAFSYILCIVTETHSQLAGWRNVIGGGGERGGGGGGGGVVEASRPLGRGKGKGRGIGVGGRSLMKGTVD